MISMGNVWDRTAEFLSDNLGAVVPIALLAIFVPAVISGNFTDLQQGASAGLRMGLSIAGLILALVSFWGQLSITALALDPSLGLSATRIGTRRLPAALLVMVVVVLCALLLAVPFGVLLAVAGVDLSNIGSGTMPAIPVAARLWVAAYLLLLVPLVLWLAARLSVLVPAVVGEGKSLGAIGESWRLTRGVALRIVGVLILYVIVSSVASLAATTAFGAVARLAVGSGEDGLSLATVLTAVVSGAVGTAFTVLATAFAAKLFVALRARDEATAAR
ncbi:hypothetical protein [Sphingomonas sp.]|uniref:hypothetical protein n=1 Tax=Sphingomonas sp. TaxID=28214 RepID=UPI001EB7D8E8|nr:hypothetical protein [Sphingomonas sp.]MBX3594105.1 hypothetical protein [Sphingomonas sp.]